MADEGRKDIQNKRDASSIPVLRKGDKIHCGQNDLTSLKDLRIISDMEQGYLSCHSKTTKVVAICILALSILIIREAAPTSTPA